MAGTLISSSCSPSKKRSAPSSAWPPVTTAASGPSARTARTSSSGDASSPRPVELARLGDVRSGHGGARQDPLDQRLLRLRLQQDRAALRHHHGIDHHWGIADQVERLGHGLDGGLVEEHPDLDRVDAHVGRHGPHLVEDELARQRLDRDHLVCVLGGERDDRRGAVDPAAGERLQVRLDPGAAAGIRGRDRHRDRNDSIVLHGEQARWSWSRLADLRRASEVRS